MIEVFDLHQGVRGSRIFYARERPEEARRITALDYRLMKMTIPDPEDPGVPGVQVRRLPREVFPADHGISLQIEPLKNKSRPIQDSAFGDFFWMASPSARICTRPFCELLEELDPGRHIFLPVPIYHWQSDDRYDHAEFFLLYSGRIVLADEKFRPRDETMLERRHGNEVTAINRNPRLRDWISQKPLWSPMPWGGGICA